MDDGVSGEDWTRYLDPGLHQVEPERQRLPHEHIGVVAVVERLLQLLQLPPREIGPGASPLTTRTVFLRLSGVCVGPPPVEETHWRILALVKASGALITREKCRYIEL